MKTISSNDHNKTFKSDTSTIKIQPISSKEIVEKYTQVLKFAHFSVFLKKDEFGCMIRKKKIK